MWNFWESPTEHGLRWPEQSVDVAPSPQPQPPGSRAEKHIMGGEGSCSPSTGDTAILSTRFIFTRQTNENLE